jgi:Anti-sigma-K factor rskA
MSSKHEEVQEALAARVLYAIDEAEAARVRELLDAHLPECAECRAALRRFETVSGELGLAAGFRRPPRLLGARIRRHLQLGGLPWWARGAVASVAIAALAGFGLWNAHLSGRVSQAERRQADSAEILTAVIHPESQVVPLSTRSPGSKAPISLTAAFVPGQPLLYVFGSMPEPEADRTYQVWLVRQGQYTSAGTFSPERGLVIVRIGVDPREYDGLLITEEPGLGSTQPSARHVVEASL